MASVARSHVIDGKVSEFLASHPAGNVVFLGGGLETTWGRVGVATARCYQVDLPEVIEVRRRALGQAANEGLIAGDMFAMEGGANRRQPAYPARGLGSLAVLPRGQNPRDDRRPQAGLSAG